MRHYLLFTFLLILIELSFGQDFRNIQIPRPVGATYPFAQVEPSISIHPDNPRKMIAGTVMNDYYFSRNGGKSWKSRSIDSKYGVNGDPVLHISGNGDYYYFHLSNPPSGHWIDRIVCERSKWICGKWKTSATKVNYPKKQDKHWVAECPVTGNLYLTWTEFDKYASKDTSDHSRIMFSKSLDQGKSWSVPAVISYFEGDCLDGDNTVEGAMPAVNEKGEIMVTWTGPNGIMMNKSSDHGKTWLPKEVKIQDHPGGWTFSVPGVGRCNGLPVLKVDRSGGKYNGRFYVNWADQGEDTTNTEIWMIYSDDFGKTWSDQIKVNQDESDRHQFFTWMDVDQKTGNLYFVYYDRRNYDDESTDVYLAYSTDGGTTIRDTIISQKPFKPNTDVFFGDYLNIAAVDGVIRPIWPRMDDEKITLWTALIDSGQLGIE
tara:strand:+ start:38160 stop:39449 length:1290 start_codon:yes stop_codon:yes gene_type:complete